MKIGIIGKPLSGKSTIFRLLTNVDSNTSNRANIGMAKVPDQRIDSLSRLYKPKKTTYAVIEFVDLAGFVSNNSGGKGNEFLNAVRDVDAIVLVVRAFESSVNPPLDGIHPMADLNQIQQELILADWSLLETRIERLEKQINSKKVVDGQKELAVLVKCKQHLEDDKPLRSLSFDDEEDKLIRGFDFFTRKPFIVLINVDEQQMKSHTYPEQEKVEAWVNERNIPAVDLCGLLEMEINELGGEDKAVFLEELGLEDTGIARLARAVYAHLGLISFFTVGEDEVRAWTIRQGSSAKEAGGKIHSDIERGFIRAEVVKYDDLIEHGSVAKLKEKGLFRLEGKEYIVIDGDVINFRFNV